LVDGETPSLQKREETYTLAVAATVGDVGQDRTDGVRPGCPLKLDSLASSDCRGDVGVDRILVADDIRISACGISIHIASRKICFKRKRAYWYSLGGIKPRSNSSSYQPGV
jgi:hypothetical protein